MDVLTCNVCRRGLRPQEVEHCDGLCAQCFDVAQPSLPCVCGHDRRNHFPDRCADSTRRNPSGHGFSVDCGCTGFQEAA